MNSLIVISFSSYSEMQRSLISKLNCFCGQIPLSWANKVMFFFQDFCAIIQFREFCGLERTVKCMCMRVYVIRLDSDLALSFLIN